MAVMVLFSNEKHKNQNKNKKYTPRDKRQMMAKESVEAKPEQK